MIWQYIRGEKMKIYCILCGCEQDFENLAGDDTKELRGNSHAVLRDNSHAVLRDNSHAVLGGNSHAVLRDNSHAVLRDNSHAELWDNSHAVLGGNSHAELGGNSHAELGGNSHAVLRDNSHAVLWGNSHAVLWGNSHAELWDNSHAECRSPYAYGILKSKTANCTGTHIGDKPLSPEEYLSSCGLEVKNEHIILFKSVNKDFTSKHNPDFKYKIGKLVIAPDWDAYYKGECGYGLHLSPTVKQAAYFHDSGTYLACKVKIMDIADLPAYTEYPDKIRVRACKPLYQVDINGEKLEVKK